MADQGEQGPGSSVPALLFAAALLELLPLCRGAAGAVPVPSAAHCECGAGLRAAPEQRIYWLVSATFTGWSQQPLNLGFCRVTGQLLCSRDSRSSAGPRVRGERSSPRAVPRDSGSCCAETPAGNPGSEALSAVSVQVWIFFPKTTTMWDAFDVHPVALGSFPLRSGRAPVCAPAPERTVRSKTCQAAACAIDSSACLESHRNAVGEARWQRAFQNCWKPAEDSATSPVSLVTFIIGDVNKS